MSGRGTGAATVANGPGAGRVIQAEEDCAGCMATAESKPGEAPPAEISQVVEHLFRHEAGKMVSTLAGIFGIDHLQLAEDVVQEALARALQTWPFYGVPKNPSAWIMRVSRNLALDVVRRERRFRHKE